MKNPIRESFKDARIKLHYTIDKTGAPLDAYGQQEIIRWLSTFDGCELVRPEPKPARVDGYMYEGRFYTPDVFAGKTISGDSARAVQLADCASEVVVPRELVEEMRDTFRRLDDNCLDCGCASAVEDFKEKLTALLGNENIITESVEKED